MEGTADVIGVSDVVRLAVTGLAEPPVTLVKMSPAEARALAAKLIEAAEHSQA